jgi:predicted ester cyclase
VVLPASSSLLEGKERTLSEQLELVYRRYIAALNDRRLDDLDQFVHDRLAYNGEEWTREQYEALLADDVRNVPDLHYDIQLLVVGPDHVACRLWFDCTPRHEFLGVDAGGRRVSFAEHAFYRFRAGRIESVWSLIDTDGVRRQLAER